DKARVLDGLEGASASAGVQFDRSRIEQILSGLGSRTFLLNNVHEDEPVVFQTRWALSYLSGPLTREQIVTLMADRRQPASDSPPAASAPRSAIAATTAEPASAGSSPLAGLQTHPPVLSARIDQRYLRVSRT